MADDKPIIIIKKGGHHGGHHGGAWKVAYADFVTAMMAFFMVMWLVNSAEVTTKENIASYFRRPGLFNSGSGTPLLVGESGILEDSFVPPKNVDLKASKSTDVDKDTKQTGSEGTDAKKRLATKGENADGTLKSKERRTASFQSPETKKDEVPQQPTAPKQLQKIGEQPSNRGDLTNKGEQTNKVEQNKEGTLVPKGPSAADLEKQALEKLANEITEKMKASPELSALLGIVDVKVDSDGLNIEIMDTEKTSMFTSGSARVLPEAKQAFLKLASLLNNLPNKIDIIGHTDAKPFTSKSLGAYSNWELSGDRANAARRLLEAGGIKQTQIAGVVGRGDRDLKNSADPFSASNRRITLRMKFNIPQKIDLSHNPEALQNLPVTKVTEDIASKETAEVQPTAVQETTHELQQNLGPVEATPVASNPKLDMKVKDVAKGYAPKKVVESKDVVKNTITVPEDAPADGDGTTSPSSEKKDKIFGNSPLIGSAGPLGSF